MIKLSIGLFILVLIFSCRKTETEYMFKKGSTNYAAAVAEIARRCKNENKKLVTNLEKTDNFDIFFPGGTTERIYQIVRKKKDNGATSNVSQYIRLEKGTSTSMTVTFVSSGTDDQDQNYSFAYTSAENKSIRDQIIEGVCDPGAKSYSGKITSSKTSLSFSDDRKQTDAGDSKKYEQTSEKGSVLNSNYPSIFYKWSGDFKRVTNLDADVDNIEITLEYEKGEYKALTSFECNDGSHDGCPAVEDPQGACGLSITANHYDSTDPRSFLVEFAGGGNCPTL